MEYEHINEQSFRIQQLASVFSHNKNPQILNQQISSGARMSAEETGLNPPELD